MAAPTEGVDDIYQDVEFYSDLSNFATDAWDYLGAPLEPVAELLYARAVSNLDTNEIVRLIDDPQSSTPVLPTAFDHFATSHVGRISQRCATASQPQFRYPPPSMGSQHAWTYNQTLAESSKCPQDDNLQTQRAALSTENNSTCALELAPDGIEQLYGPGSGSQDLTTQNWVDSAYATGDRVQPSSRAQTAEPWQPLQHPEDALRSIEQPALVQSQPQLQWQLPSTRQIARPQSEPSTTLSRLTCDYPGCKYTSTKRDDVRHHKRRHTPKEDLPHPCPVCALRFLHPREVRRHLPTHGLGIRHYCQFSHCQQSFGRRDHLLRHTRNKHAADSVVQSSETLSQI